MKVQHGRVSSTHRSVISTSLPIAHWYIRESCPRIWTLYVANIREHSPLAPVGSDRAKTSEHALSPSAPSLKNDRIRLANLRASPRVVLALEGVRRSMSPEVTRGGRVLSLKPHVIQPVPEETAHVARAACVGPSVSSRCAGDSGRPPRMSWRPSPTVFETKGPRAQA
jgi:hypothetical protein